MHPIVFMVATAVWDRPVEQPFQPFNEQVLELVTTRRELALTVWENLLNTPYLWGGNDPLVGFDCSGFVIEGLKSAGILPREGDWTAQSLVGQQFKDYRRLRPHEIIPGTLLFWKRGATIGHVEVVYRVVGQTVFTIGASGGGSTTRSLADAVKQDAYIKIRPATSGWTVALDPFEV